MGMMAAEKKSFVLYHDIRTPLELLTDEQRGKLFIALLDYSEHGELPDFDGALLMAFAFIRTSLDRDAEAWAEKRAKRAEAGRNGGLAKAANASIASGAKQSVANLAVNVPVNVPAPVPVNLSTTTGGGRGTADKPPRASPSPRPPLMKSNLTAQSGKTMLIQHGSLTSTLQKVGSLENRKCAIGGRLCGRGSGQIHSRRRRAKTGFAATTQTNPLCEGATI